MKRRSWAVIGGGPCGIATVGRLLDLNQSVTWIDPSFTSGRMGKFYRRVPANTLNGDLLVATRMCQSFEFERYQKIRRDRGEIVMSDLDLEKCYDLGLLVDSLEDMTKELLPKVVSKLSLNPIKRRNVKANFLPKGIANTRRKVAA